MAKTKSLESIDALTWKALETFPIEENGLDIIFVADQMPLPEVLGDQVYIQQCKVQGIAPYTVGSFVNMGRYPRREIQTLEPKNASFTWGERPHVVHVHDHVYGEWMGEEAVRKIWLKDLKKEGLLKELQEKGYCCAFACLTVSQESYWPRETDRITINNKLTNKILPQKESIWRTGHMDQKDGPGVNTHFAEYPWNIDEGKREILRQWSNGVQV
ncbi:MAG: hypothetical protein Q7R96_03785 [Nanoarchaeota archaeon]|nr:hypothetical protein [Nanoarchaeota archaeon]